MWRRFSRANWTSDDVRALLAQHFAEMRAGSPPEACHVLPIDGLKDPAIRFFTLREDGVLLGCGALKRLEPGHGEVKSMRTADAALGRGVGKAMLDHLVATARAEGMTRLSLETGSTDSSRPPTGFMRKKGFERCGPFGDYADTPFTRFFTQGNLGPLDPRREAAAGGVVGVDMIDRLIGQHPADRRRPPRPAGPALRRSSFRRASKARSDRMRRRARAGFRPHRWPPRWRFR